MSVASMCSREILVDIYNWVLTRYELLSLAPDKLVLSAVVSMMAR